MSDLHIARIKGSGFLNLRAVDVVLEDGVVKVGGDNRQGKTSLLKLIELLAGKAAMPELAKTEGEKKGKFQIDIDDKDGVTQYLVKYSFTDKNSYVSIEDPAGEKVGQTIFNEMLSPCLNPWGFFQDAIATGTGAKARRAKAIELLKELMTVNYDMTTLLAALGVGQNTHVLSLMSQHKDDPLALLAALEAMYVENRALWNAKVTTLTGTVATLKKEIPPAERDAKEMDVEALFAQQRELHAVQSAHSKYETEHNALEERVMAAEGALEYAKAALEAKRLEAEKLPACDQAALEELADQIKSVSARNEQARKARDLKEKETALEAAIESAEAKNEAVTLIREAKMEALESAEMPIEGLAIEDGNITKHGIPLGQDSHEEGLTDSLMIALAKFNKMGEDAPKLKTLLLPDASLLGKKATERIIQVAKEHGVQLVMELVMDERQSGVIFVEDGVAENV